MKTDFFQRYYLLVLLVFALAIYFVFTASERARQTSNNDIKQWLPENREVTQNYKKFVSHFGSDEFAIISWEGCTIGDPRVSRFVEVLEKYRDEKGQKLFAEFQTGPRMLDQMTSMPFDLDPDEARRRLTGVSIGSDGESTCVIVKLTEAGDANRRETVAALRRLVTTELDTAEVDLTEEDVHMAGDAVTNAEVDIASQQAINSLIVLCGITALVCAFLSLRSLGLVIVVFLTALYSSCFPEAMVHWLGGTMNLVLVVMPILVLVLTLSAGVHLVNYYRDALRDAPEAEAPGIAVAHGWLPCAMAGLTTAIGLGSLCVSPIKPVGDFGFYSALGIVFSLVFIFLLLPSLLVALQKLPHRLRKILSINNPSKSAATRWDKPLAAWAGFVVDHKTVLAGGCMAILILVGIGACFTKTSVRPTRFFDEDSRLIRDYRWLSHPDRFGPQVPIELVVQFDNRKTSLTTLEQLRLIRDMQADLLTNGGELIGSALSATTFAPELDVERGANDALNERVMNRRLAANRPAYSDVHYYSCPLRASGGANVDWQSVTPDEELWRISARIRRTELDYDIITKKVAEHISDFLAARSQNRAKQREKVDIYFDALVRREEQKLAKKEERYANDPDQLAKEKQDFANDVAFMNKRRNKYLAAIKDDTLGVSMDYTGMVPLFYEAQNELLWGLFISFILAFGLIAVVMVGWFRSLPAGLLTMFPNVFPAAVIFGFMGWRGWIVDIGSMMTASVAMGIAVDDTVHYLTWFRRGLRDGLSRRDALIDAYLRCARPMTQTTLIAGLGLLVFSLSNFQPVSQFGLLMFVLLVAALVGDLIFLPALLAGRAGKLFEPKVSVPVEHPVEQPVA